MRDAGAMEDVEDETSDPRMWKKSGWIARVIKNENDEGWAASMTRVGDPEPVLVSLDIELDADFADIFEVRRLAGDPSGRTSGELVAEAPGELRFKAPGTARTTTVLLDPVPELVDQRTAQWTVGLTRDQPWVLRTEVRAHRGTGAEQRPAIRPRIEHVGRPDVVVLSEPERLARATLRSLADLDALSIPDDRDPSRRLLAAGIPWFVALFGRDVLISSYQARAFRPELMTDALAALAARQGLIDDPGNGEQPGKILHEVRFGDLPWLGEGTSGGVRPYYGSADSTPLFLIMLGEAMRWGAPREVLEALLPPARAALQWLRGPGDPDRDGLIEYASIGPRSLVNQGWKDSENAVQFADGRLATAPIAVVEVQGYAYRARRELAAVLDHLGFHAEAADLAAEAAQLRSVIRHRYWHPGSDGAPGYFAMALDGDKRQVDSITSNMAHLLWCGVPTQSEAEQVAAHLASPAMASGWGLRTLSDQMAGFNPISYHVGSVWPHDTVLACEGLRRYGLDDVAMRLAEQYHRIPAVLRDSLVQQAVGLIPTSETKRRRVRDVKRFLEAASLPKVERYLRWVSVFDTAAKQNLYSANFLHETQSIRAADILAPWFAQANGAGIVDTALLADINTYLPNDLLVKVDIATMAVSLEARSPFLDHHLIEFAASLPEKLKLRGLTTKYLLKRMLRKMLPAENLDRRKMGFGVPIGHWFRGKLQPFLREAILSERSLNRGLFRPEAVKQLVELHTRGERDYSHQLWTLLMLELWFQRFID